MRSGFLVGLAIGLVVGVVLGYVTTHFWGWLFIGIAVGILVAASRTRRNKYFPPRAAGQ